MRTGRPQIHRARTTIRRAMMWIGTALTVTLLALWAAGLNGDQTWRRGQLYIFTSASLIEFGYSQTVAVDVRRYRPYLGRPILALETPVFSVFRFDPNLGGGGISISSWLLFAVVGSVAFVPWWLDIRARRRARKIGHCPHCRYDRTGLAPETPCPECGSTGDSQHNGGPHAAIP